MKEFWVVDADSQIIERWRPDDVRPEVIANVIHWQLGSGHEPLRIDLSTVFRAR